MDTEERLEEITYKKKLELAYHTLGKVQPTDTATFESASLINVPKLRRPLLVLSLTDTVDKHLKLAWEGPPSKLGMFGMTISLLHKKEQKECTFQAAGLQILCH